MEVDAKLDFTDAQKYLYEIMRRMGSAEPALRLIGEIGHESIQTNFEEGGRPSQWKPLADSTIKQRTKAGKWPGRILVRTGTSGGLMGAVSYKAFNDRVIFSANKVYARIQHYGGKAGRGRKVTIPARQYMMIQDEDWQEINEALKEYIIRGTAGG